MAEMSEFTVVMDNCWESRLLFRTAMPQGVMIIFVFYEINKWINCTVNEHH